LAGGSEVDVRKNRVEAIFANDPGARIRGPMSISLTDSAATRVKSFLAARGRGMGLRLGVRKTGCSGFAYVINYADGPEPGDAVYEDHGVQVFVDAASVGLLDGTIVDFVKQGLNEAFRFRNPNVKGECGCGESFSV
jgi:iron-sulfur cluster assembly protein